MSKAAALAATGIGGGGAAFGGYLIFTNDGSGGSKEATEQTQNTPQTDLLTNIVQPKETTTQLTLNTFKTSDTKTIDCLKDLFTSTSIDFNTPTTPPNTLPADSDNKYFGESVADGAQGCLVINYEKKKEDGDKWSGTFTWTWTFVNDNKGFINFNSAQTAENKELKLTGGFYLLDKSTTETPNKWKITWKEEVETSGDKKVVSSDLATKFPKKLANSQINISDKDYWGFLDGEVPTTDAKTSQKWIWKYTKGDDTSTDKVDGWTHDLQWWSNLYDKSKDFKLSEKLANFKGKWEKVSPQA